MGTFGYGKIIITNNTNENNKNSTITILWSFYCISCSNDSNSDDKKKVPKEMSKPSHSFFIVIIDTSLRFESTRLYTVDGVTPDKFAISFNVIFFSLHKLRKRATTASLTLIKSPQKHFIGEYARAYTHLRKLEK